MSREVTRRQDEQLLNKSYWLVREHHASTTDAADAVALEGAASSSSSSSAVAGDLGVVRPCVRRGSLLAACRPPSERRRTVLVIDCSSLQLAASVVVLGFTVHSHPLHDVSSSPLLQLTVQFNQIYGLGVRILPTAVHSSVPPSPLCTASSAIIDDDLLCCMSPDNVV